MLQEPNQNDITEDKRVSLTLTRFLTLLITLIGGTVTICIYIGKANTTIEQNTVINAQQAQAIILLQQNQTALNNVLADQAKIIGSQSTDHFILVSELKSKNVLDIDFPLERPITLSPVILKPVTTFSAALHQAAQRRFLCQNLNP